MRLPAHVLLVLLATGCEPSPEICADGVDNNGDKAIDCDDEFCESRPDCRGALVFAESFVDRHYWFEDEAVGMGTGDSEDFEWGGDLDGDGLTDVSLSRNPYLSLAPIVTTSDVVAIPSSWIEDHDLVDLDGPHLLLETPNGACVQSTTSQCDIDGDGYDELVQVDTCPTVFQDDPSSRPLSLSLLLGGPAGADWPGEPIVLPLESLGRVGLAVHCAGDLDGDGAGDLVLSYQEENWLLDGPALAAGTPPGQTVRRYWDSWPNRELVGPGDLDGDGYDDLFFRRNGGDTCDFDDEWPHGSILPGGSHLSEPRSSEISIYDEELPAVDLWVEAVESEECIDLGSSFGATHFADLDGDSRQEFVRSRLFQEGINGWGGVLFSDLSHDIHLWTADASIRVTRDQMAQTAVGSLMGGDLDGDGTMDIVGSSGALLAPGTVPWTIGGESRGYGLAVFYGTDSPDQIDLAWEDADVFVVTQGGLANLRIVEDRDGDGLLEIGYVGFVFHPREAPYDVPTAGFIPGSALLPFKR